MQKTRKKKTNIPEEVSVVKPEKKKKKTEKITDVPNKKKTEKENKPIEKKKKTIEDKPVVKEKKKNAKEKKDKKKAEDTNEQMESTFRTQNLANIRWSGKKLSIAAEKELMRRYQLTGDEEAANVLIENNIALVKGVISKFSPQETYFDDLLVEGVMGLLHAAKKFDLSRNTRLSTYAHYYIHLNISRFLDTQTKTIKVPVNKTTEIRRSLRESGFDGLSPELKKIAQNNELLSLDYQIETSQSQEKTIYDILPDKGKSPDEITNDKLFTEDLLKIIDTLNEKEAFVFKSYYGVGESKKNLNDLSKILGVTHQRVSQIFKAASEKLATEPRASKLRELIILYDKTDIIPIPH